MRGMGMVEYGRVGEKKKGGGIEPPTWLIWSMAITRFWWKESEEAVSTVHGSVYRYKLIFATLKQPKYYGSILCVSWRMVPAMGRS
jgi:hypothetical protein